MADSSGADHVVAKAAAAIVSTLEERLAELTRSTQELLVAEIDELRGDTQLLKLLGDTVSSNIDTFFSAVRHRIPIKRIEPPAAAVEYARRLAQHEVSANALVRAYRLGHQAVLKTALEEIRASQLEPKLGLEVHELIAAVSFNYIDRMLTSTSTERPHRSNRIWSERSPDHHRQRSRPRGGGADQQQP